MPDQVMEPVAIEDLKKGVIVPEVEFEAFLRQYDWTWHQLARSEFPAPFEDLQEFQLACICQDPYLWCQAFLREPTDPDHKEPYNFFPYQVEDGIRNLESTIYYCGAEVGKTRDIIAKEMYVIFNRPSGSGLTGAPQQTHLDEIIGGLDDQLRWNPDLGKCLAEWKKSPHHLMRFTNDFKLYFRPAGHDGEAYRGVHVRDFIVVDEAAKKKNKKQWSELWRAALPGCPFFLYSVPDGDRSSEFFRLGQKAQGENVEIKDLADRAFRFVRWRKTQMRAPFWTDERRRHYIELFGGEDSPEYRQNILGEDGDPVNSVFPWPQFARVIKDIDAYRVLKIFVDQSSGEVSITGNAFRPVSVEGKPSTPENVLLEDKRVPMGIFDIAAEIKRFFSGIPGELYIGADLGFSQDPTEILIKLVFGRIHRLIGRLQLKGVTYDLQDEAINALDDIFSPQGIGLDLGNAGSAVLHNLCAKYPHKRFDDRATGYQFASTHDAVDEAGNVIMDKLKEKPVKLTMKELATDFLTRRIQRQQQEYPFDPDILLFYPNHTYRQGQDGRRIYRKEDDHVIDADRVCELRAILPNIGLYPPVDGCTFGECAMADFDGSGAFLT